MSKHVSKKAPRRVLRARILCILGAAVFTMGSAAVFAEELPALPESQVLSGTEMVSYSFQLDAIPYSTVRIPGSKTTGNIQVLVPGEQGLKVSVIRVLTKNGEEVSRMVTQESVLRAATDQVIYQGNGETLKTGEGEWIAYNRVLEMKATAYTTENKKWKNTFSGTTAKVGTVAVDPKVIPLGTKLFITSADSGQWMYGEAVAEDTGVKGNIIDLFFNTRQECVSFGVRKCMVYVLE